MWPDGHVRTALGPPNPSGRSKLIIPPSLERDHVAAYLTAYTVKAGLVGMAGDAVLAADGDDLCAAVNAHSEAASAMKGGAACT